MASHNAVAIQSVNRPKSILLRFVAAFLMLGSLSSLGLLFSSAAINLGFLFQAALVVAAIVTGASALGLWQHRRWAAHLYIGFTAFNQPFLFLMGWWSIGALLIPATLIGLVLIKYRSLT